jgi:hypothetical protein
MTMKPMTAALTGALISGVAMYTVGAKALRVDEPAPVPAIVQTVDGQFVQVGYLTPTPQLRPAAAAPIAAVTQVRQAAPAPARRTVSRTTPVGPRQVVREEAAPKRSWTKTAMVIGGTSAGSAGIGGLIGGKKGALIGAAIGGGAASIYEARKRN